MAVKGQDCFSSAIRHAYASRGPGLWLVMVSIRVQFRVQATAAERLAAAEPAAPRRDARRLSLRGLRRRSTPAPAAAAPPQPPPPPSPVQEEIQVAPV